MNEHPHHIVCATRGGEGSRAAQLAAIDLAHTSGATLSFLYVVDPQRVPGVEEPLETAVSRELSWMGQTLLHIAKGRAQAAGIAATSVLRYGQIPVEIGRYLQEQQASHLILGAPRGATANMFGDDAIEQLANTLESQTQVTVQIIYPEPSSLGQAIN